MFSLGTHSVAAAVVGKKTLESSFALGLTYFPKRGSVPCGDELRCGVRARRGCQHVDLPQQMEGGERTTDGEVTSVFCAMHGV